MKNTLRTTLTEASRERGVALPLAMIMLAMLTALMMAFAVLAQTEPTIANNHQRTTQSRGLTESGIERVLWALNNPADANGIGPMAAGTTAPAPYNGNTVLAMGALGGFSVQVTYDAVLNTQHERTVTSVGWIPNKDANALNPHRKIQTVVQRGVIPPIDPACVLCVAGAVEINGSSSVFNSALNGCDSNNPPQYAVQAVSGISYNANPTFLGYGTVGDAALNTPPNSDAFRYPQPSLDRLKALAQANGTYYQGLVTSLPASGVVFIDTVDGSPYTSSTPDGQSGRLDLTAGGTFTGVIIVAGSVTKLRSTTINGLLYAMNDVNIAGDVTIDGAVVSENRKDNLSTTVDSSLSGTVNLNFNCANIRYSQGLSSAWVVKPGSFTEIAGY